MGLRQHIAAGAKLRREIRTFVTAPGGSGSITLPPAAALLRIQSSATCRLRLYDTESALLDAGEISRAFSNTAVSSSIALIGDFTMSANIDNFVDPVVYSVPQNTTGAVYYRIQPSGSATITLTYFPLEDAAVPPTPDTSYTDANRRTLTIERTLNDATPVSGTLAAPLVPKTFLLVSASLGNSAHHTRLRLYRDSGALHIPSEQSRSFSTEPSASTQLITDIIISGSGPLFFTPKIIGANLSTMGINLESIRDNRDLFGGVKEIYYLMQNLGSAATIQASIHVFSLED
jgi:hypothetical protein